MKTIISEYTRTWKYDNEESYSGVSFSLDNKPSERILLVKDIWYPGTWNIHFLGEFSEGEKQTLMTEINNYIKSGEYLTSCGCCTPEDISGFQRFSFNTSLLIPHNVIDISNLNFKLVFFNLLKAYIHNKDKSLIEKTIYFSDDARMNEEITRWLAYKKERGQTYKTTGLKAFITRLGNLSGGNGEVALKIVEQSMANNYSGVFPLNSNRAVTNTPDMGVVLQDSNNKDYSKGGW